VVVLTGFVMCVCVCACACACACGAGGGFVMCFGNMCTCIYCVFVLFCSCIFILFLLCLIL
jgi:hypothetical protein